MRRHSSSVCIFDVRWDDFGAVLSRLGSCKTLCALLCSHYVWRQSRPCRIVLLPPLRWYANYFIIANWLQIWCAALIASLSSLPRFSFWSIAEQFHNEMVQTALFMAGGLYLDWLTNCKWRRRRAGSHAICNLRCMFFRISINKSAIVVFWGSATRIAAHFTWIFALLLHSIISVCFWEMNYFMHVFHLTEHF